MYDSTYLGTVGEGLHEMQSTILVMQTSYATFCISRLLGAILEIAGLKLWIEYQIWVQIAR